ncbi:hypothetical protein KQI82_11895 [Oscillibacter sp. MSJ-2]|uniref:Membrane protein YczE n=1 Tax=Dysosmobacter acutus TaxID=2841504 RepID=A0ABS6FBU0_9FIRM|nr:hypothetical protein [Dysosmobacter acutus]MBU5627612.1 hypothetical protein [Dysosmobacter acutus]
MSRSPRLMLLPRTLQAAGGLFVAAFGIYLTIQANIGLAPWDALNMGLSRCFGISYGTASILLSVFVVGADLLLGERIGMGTLLDAVLVGLSIDLFTALEAVPLQTSLPVSFAVLVLGLFIIAVGQLIYMRSALCCGPRDSLLVALGKRMRRLPIGTVNVILLGMVICAAWLLRGPIGMGTLVSVFGLGAAMQAVFRLFRFEPRDVRHTDFLEMGRLLCGRAAPQDQKV